MPRKELAVEPRDVLGKKVATLRRQGVLPANVFGHGIESLAVQVDTEALAETIRVATANEVIDLHIAGERAARPVVIYKVQRHPLGRGLHGYLHADFYQVSLREKMRAEVPIEITGVSEGVATYNGTLLHGLDTLHVEALPLDLPANIVVDITPLAELESAIHVRDIVVPANVTVLNDPDVVVVRVESPRVAVEGAPSEEGEAEGEGT